MEAIPRFPGLQDWGLLIFLAAAGEEAFPMFLKPGLAGFFFA